MCCCFPNMQRSDSLRSTLIATFISFTDNSYPAMSLAPKRLRRRQPKPKPLGTPTALALVPTIDEEPPILLRTSRQVKAAYSRRTVPLVTTSGIHGTYTFLPQGSSLQHEAPSSDAARSLSPSPDNSEITDAPEVGVTSDFVPPLQPSGYIRKRAQQSSNWTLRVIPELLPLYHRLLRTTQSLSRFQTMPVPACTCAIQTRQVITVLCLHFDCECVYYYQLIFIDVLSAARPVQLTVCPCRTIPSQLMCRGLFPCAPVHPTLAVDLKLLEFARIQFLALTPNVSGWCEAIVTFLRGLAFKLEGKVFI